MRALKRYVVISDVHVPYHSTPHHDVFLQFLRDFKPTGLIVNGDFLDLLELSSHATASVAQLEGLRVADSFKAANHVLDDYLRAAGRGCTDNHFVDGNHEDRLRRWMERGDNAVWMDDEATDIGHRLHLKDRSFVYHKGYPEACVKLGHLVITHGRWCGRYPAAKHLDMYRHSVLIGHVHSPQVFHGPGFLRQQAGYAAGLMGDTRSRAMHYAPRPNGWRHGFATVALEPNGNFHCNLLTFVEGKLFANGRLYAPRRPGRKRA